MRLRCERTAGLESFCEEAERRHLGREAAAPKQASERPLTSAQCPKSGQSGFPQLPSASPKTHVKSTPLGLTTGWAHSPKR